MAHGSLTRGKYQQEEDRIPVTLLLNFLGHPILECQGHTWGTHVPPNVSFPNICLSS